MEFQLLNILMMINSNILMPRLVVLHGVRVLQGDIFLEPDSCLHSSGYIARAPLSNFFVSMWIIVFNAAGPATYLCIMFALMGKSGLVAMRINLSKYESSSSRTYAFVLAWVRVPIDGIACVHTTTSILLNTRAWEACILVMICGSYS